MLQSTQAGMPGIFLGWQKQCKSPLAYREVGKGREQDAEALRAIWAVTIEVVALFAIRPQAGSYGKNLENVRGQQGQTLVLHFQAELQFAVAGCQRSRFSFKPLCQLLLALLNTLHLQLLPLLDGFNELRVLVLKLLLPTGTCVELFQFYPGRLEFHAQACPQYLELWRPLAVLRQAQQCASGNEPLVDVQLPPANTATVVILEHVMIIVITLTVRNQGNQVMVPGRVFISVWLLTPHVSEGVDEECRMVDDYQPGNACQQKHPDNVTGQPAQKNRYSEIGDPDQGPIPAVLPGRNRIPL